MYFCSRCVAVAAVWLTLAGCSQSTPATSVAPNPVPGTGTNPQIPPQITPAPVSRVFIENKKIRLGIDLNLGGSIVYLAETGGANLINNHDYGRQSQTALYGGPVPYYHNGQQPAPGWPYLGWSPIQTGDSYGHTSPVITYRQDSTHLYVKTAALLSVFNNQSANSIMEHWIEIVDNTAHVRSRTTFNRPDTTQYTSRPQEQPGAYFNAPYSRIMVYQGNRPFTNDAVSELNIQNTDEVHHAPECWVALLNQQGRGVGLFEPNQPRFNVGFFGKPGIGDEYSDPTGYLAGKEQAILDHNGTYEYEYTLITGTLTDIRQFVYSQPRPSAGPNYRFANDRQHWYYQKTTDTGVPIRGELNVHFDGDRDLLLLSPEMFWRGSDIAKLYVQAAFKTPAQTARLGWRRHGDPAPLPTPDRYIDFPIIGDGQYRTYEINMNQSAGWRDNAIIQLFLSPSAPDNERSGRSVRIRSITTTPP